MIHLEGTIVKQIRAGLYLVNVEPGCAERIGLGQSHDDPTLVQGANDAVVVEHNAVREWVRVVLRGEPQERNDVTIGCWVLRDGDYNYAAASGRSETMPAYKVCAAPAPTPGSTQTGADSKSTGSASGQ